VEFADPKAVVLNTFQPLVTDLRKPALGRYDPVLHAAALALEDHGLGMVTSLLLIKIVSLKGQRAGIEFTTQEATISLRKPSKSQLLLSQNRLCPHYTMTVRIRLNGTWYGIDRQRICGALSRRES
jgi:hypothetical protein